MFNLGGGEILVILLLALIVLGPQRLPEAARKLGTAIGEVRRMATGFQNEIKSAFDEAELTGSTPTTPTTATARPVTEGAPPTGVRSANGATPPSLAPATPMAPGTGGDGAESPTQTADAGQTVEPAAGVDRTDGDEPTPVDTDAVEPVDAPGPTPVEPPGAASAGPGPAADRDDAVA